MVRPLDVLILGHNYSPELTGIAPCTTGMAEALAKNRNVVRVVCGTPSYPDWTVAAGYSRWLPSRREENGVTITRLPHIVPKRSHGWPRLLHHASFAVLAIGALLKACCRRPDIIIAVVPSTLSASVARLAAKLFRRPLWVHVQDLELDMALATGNFSRSRWRTRFMRAIERFALSADRVSSISPAMCDRLVAKGVAPARLSEFKNWASPDVGDMQGLSSYRREWGLTDRHVALYSGSLAAKQGLEIILDAARLLAHRRDILFVICGNGPNRAALMEAARGCGSVLFHDLQPMDRLPELLSTATVHLLPQIASAADLVLPSKLPNMLATGRPVIATAGPQTGLAHEVEGCGLVTPPHDAPAFAAAIERLIDDAELRATFGAAAVARAAERWSMTNILDGFERDLRALVVEREVRSWRQRWRRPNLSTPFAE